jgi:hypothetical protein
LEFELFTTYSNSAFRCACKRARTHIAAKRIVCPVFNPGTDTAAPRVEPVRPGERCFHIRRGQLQAQERVRTVHGPTGGASGTATCSISVGTEHKKSRIALTAFLSCSSINLIERTYSWPAYATAALST